MTDFRIVGSRSFPIYLLIAAVLLLGASMLAFDSKIGSPIINQQANAAYAAQAQGYLVEGARYADLFK